MSIQKISQGMQNNNPIKLTALELCLVKELCPLLDPKAVSQSDAFDVLTQPHLDALRFNGDNLELAESTFSQLTPEDVNKMDCAALNKLARRVAALVHPDKASASHGR